jgi:hypothetical protein
MRQCYPNLNVPALRKIDHEIAREQKTLQNNHSKKAYAGLCELRAPSPGAREEWRWYVKDSAT